MADHDIMLDIETLAKNANSVVVTIGAVKFHRHGKGIIGQALHVYLDMDQQKSMNRTVDPSTVAWWDKQNAAVRADAFRTDGRISVEAALDQLKDFCKDANTVWAQGPLFDMKILEHLIDSVGKRPGWRFWAVRDSRTLFDVLGDTRNNNAEELHNAAQDAKNQAVAAQYCFRRISLLHRIENIMKIIRFWR